MSGLSLSIDIEKGAKPLEKEFYARLTDHRGLNEAIAKKAQVLTIDHLVRISNERRNSLGGKPTGHWAQAAEKTSYTFDDISATITVSHPGIGRAMHDVDIYPGAGKKALTIPLIAEAYNVRAASIWESEGLFVKKGKNGKGKNVAVVVKRLEDGSLQPWYLLVPSVHQKQDRTLLPSDDEYTQTGVEAAGLYIDTLLSRI